MCIRDSYTATTRYVGKNISRELDDIQDICNYMFVNSDVKNVIENSGEKNYAYVRSVDNLDRLLIQNVMANVYSLSLIHIYTSFLCKICFILT